MRRGRGHDVGGGRGGRVGRGRGQDLRQIDEDLATETEPSEEPQLVPYQGGNPVNDENKNAAHWAAQGRGGQAGHAFGYGLYGGRGSCG